MNAACDVTADNPLRGTSIDAVANRLGWVDWLQIDNVVAIAAARSWVRTSGGAKPHSISVTQTWQRERDLT